MKVKIDQELVLSTVPGGEWELCNDRGVSFSITLSCWKFEQEVIVPQGFRTDLNSGHFLPESWHHRSRHAALLHDYLYRTGTYTRKQADSAFYWALQSRGVKPYRAELMYLAVRAFGWRAWNKHRRNEKC